MDGQVITYADDTCLLFSGATWKSVHDKATNGLNKVVRSLTNRKLSLNTSKTFYMTFTINNTQIPISDLKIHFCENTEKCANTNTCKKIQRVQSIRYLGITIDKHLRWDLHINYLIKRLRISLNHFYKLQSVLPKHLIRIVYISFYQAVLQYGVKIWGGATANVIKPLQLQQNKIIRVCLGKKDLVGSTVHNYKELNVLPFKLIYQKLAILWVIKNINTWFNLKRVEDKRINRAYNAPVAYTNTSYGQRFLDYQGPTIFNSMNNELKNTICVTPKYAKKLVSDWLFTNMEKL